MLKTYIKKKYIFLKIFKKKLTYETIFTTSNFENYIRYIYIYVPN